MERDPPKPSEPSVLPGTNFLEWYSRQPRWLHVVLAPLVFVVLVFQGLAVFGLFFVYIPYLFVQGYFESLHYWRKLRKQGRVVEWPEVERRVSEGSGTLVVEITEKGPSTGWLVDVPRNTLDPEHLAPTWSNLELRGFSVVREFEMEQMDRWSVAYLAPHLAKSRMLPARLKQLHELSYKAKSTSVLAVYWLHEGLLNTHVRDDER